VTQLNATKIGVLRNSTRKFLLDFDGNGRWNAALDKTYNFSTFGDLPTSGNWDNNRTDKIGVFRNSTHNFYLDYNGNGTWNGPVVDRLYNFGTSGDLPVSGDWNKDGFSEIGIFRNSTILNSTILFYLDYNGNGMWDGNVTDRQYNFSSIKGDLPTSGDWNNDGISEIGVFRNSTKKFLLDFNGNGTWDGTVIDRQYTFGAFGDKPVTGKWS
jgi:hypothetical protein